MQIEYFNDFFNVDTSISLFMVLLIISLLFIFSYILHRSECRFTCLLSLVLLKNKV